MDQDEETRIKFWGKIGALNTDRIAPLINSAFMQNLPQWPSLQQSYMTIKKANGNTIIATDGLSSKFDPRNNPTNTQANGYELELYVETDEQITDIQTSYLFNIIYQASLFAAYRKNLKDMLDKYGVITTELYDIKVPEKYLLKDGGVGVILGLTTPDIPDSLQLSSSSIRIVNVKLLTPEELEYSISQGAQGRDTLKDLFNKSSKTISNLSRTSALGAETKQTPTDMPEKKIPLLYYLPHMYLKDAIFNNWQSFYGVIKQGPSVLKANLVHGFEALKQDPKGIISNKDVTLESDAFSAILTKAGDNKELLTIKFPTPTDTTEVAYVAILLSPDTPRYFTFELHRPNDLEKQMFPEKNYDTYKVCEWNKDGRHNVFESEELKAPDVDIFVNTIKKYI